MTGTELEKIVERICKRFSIPSVSAAWIIDGRLIKKSVGCDESTSFAIGSCTKSIVAGTVMALSDQNKLSIDDKALRYLPGYTLPSKITLRDLLSHRSGMPGCDLTWYSCHDSFSEEDLKRVLANINPNGEPGEKYQYNNMMFSLLGPVLENCSDDNWKETVRKYIFEPLGINQVAFSPKEAALRGNVAKPYVCTERGNIPVPYASIGAVAPAGCLYMTAEELLKWNTLLLQRGMWNGKQILSEKAVQEMISPQIEDPYDGSIPELADAVKHRSYCLGLQSEEFRGEKLVFHGGAIDGFLAEQFFLPSKNFAAVFLSDLGGTWAREAFRYAVAGCLLDDSTDWIEAFYQLQKTVYKTYLEAFRSFPEEINSSLYGEYANPIHGRLLIRRQDEKNKAVVGDIAMEIRMNGKGFLLMHPDFGLIRGETVQGENAVLIETEPGIKMKFIRMKE